MSIFEITKEQSQANVKASEVTLKAGLRAVENGLSGHIKDVVIHSVAHNCPHVCANLVKLLDEEGLTKQVKAVKSFLNKFTAASLKGENPTINDERKEKLDHEAIAKAIDTMQELGIMGWYAEQTDKADKKSATTEAEKRAATQKRAINKLNELAENDLILKAGLDYMVKLRQVAEKNEAMALDMAAADLRGLTKGLTGTLQNLEETKDAA